MKDTDIITSVQNAHVKRLLALQQKSSERRHTGLFVVEGQRELGHCITAGLEIETLVVCRELAGDEVPDCSHRLMEVSPYVYSKIAYRGGTEGVMAVVQSRSHSLADLQLKNKNPLVLVVESVEKPGNLGAILRSADAAGVDALIVCDPLTDLYNPNIIRSSVGALFTVPCALAGTEECIGWLRQHGMQILTAQLQDSKPYYDCDMQRPTAIVMGTESTGLSQPWRDAATSHILIPMQGRLDSLNVSVSAAILLFEAVRQRKG